MFGFIYFDFIFIFTNAFDLSNIYFVYIYKEAFIFSFKIVGECANKKQMIFYKKIKEL